MYLVESSSELRLACSHSFHSLLVLMHPASVLSVQRCLARTPLLFAHMRCCGGLFVLLQRLYFFCQCAQLIRRETDQRKKKKKKKKK